MVNELLGLKSNALENLKEKLESEFSEHNYEDLSDEALIEGAYSGSVMLKQKDFSFMSEKELILDGIYCNLILLDRLESKNDKE